MLLVVLSAFAAMPAVPAKAASQQSGTLYLAMQQDMPDFNTWNLASNSVWKSNVIGWGFEGLAGLDFDMLPYPLLAESWDFDEDTLEVTITLRQDVKFHDGTDLTAEDVVFMYHHVREGTTYSSNIINAFDIDDDGEVSVDEIETGVELVDDYTILMRMAKPYGQFFTNTLGIPVMPKAIWEDHLTADGLLDVLWNDPAATISTGVYKYKEGTPNTYRIMERFEDYWGKDFETPAGYAIYPQNVEQLYYKIYASLDTAILALQAGAVDHITWPITAGRVPSLSADPNIGLEYLEDNGYFYLAFNMKFEPMNDIDFRKAVSHLIDKDQIVNVYMGGFGSKGGPAEPPYWGEWSNESVPSYPYDDPFDSSSEVPEDYLDDAGFVDVNGDGWRDLPDGRPMEKIIILTPPADYDPVRIRAGQMIAKNMREVGINTEAKAIDFDTLVARLQSMDYQMLIIGWSLSSDPVSNVFDILGPKSTSNTFGFWAEDDPNPFYQDLMGVNTLADEETQELAYEVDRLAGLARESFDVEDQIFYTRWAQGVLAEANPCNVLYYRVSILAYRATSWTGWLPWLGDIFGPGSNLYSLANLERYGAGGTAGEAAATVNAGLSVPGKALVGGVIDGYVTAINNAGVPVAGATVALSLAGVAGGPVTLSAGATSGATDADGVWEFNLTGVNQGFSYVNVTVTSAGVTSTQSTTVSVVKAFPDTLFMAVSTEKSVLLPGEETKVMITVIDGNDDPVEGATCALDPNLMGYGTIADESLETNETGYAETTYTAPAEIGDLNTHLLLTLSYQVSKEGYAWANPASVNMLILNEDEPDWIMARVGDVSSTALSEADDTATITIEVVDDEGTPLADHRLNVTYSDPSSVVAPTWELLTDGGGLAVLDVQVAMADTGALRVTVANTTVLNSASATITLTYLGDTTPDPEIYGGYLTYAESAQYMGPLGSVEVTAHVWDSAGAPADVTASLLLSATPYGSLVWTDDVNWDTLWDYLGTAMLTTEDGGNFVTSGPMNTVFDQDNYDLWYYDNYGWLFWEWGDMTGVEVVDGEYTFEIYGIGVAHVCQIGSIYLVPNGYGYFNESTLSYQVDGQTMITNEYVIGRSYNVVAPAFSISNPSMVARVSGFDSSLVDVWVSDETGAPIEGAWVEVYENSMTGNLDYAVIPYSPSTRWTAPVATDDDGYAQATILAVGYPNVVTPASISALVYVKASMEGYISLFSDTKVFIFTQQSFVTLEPITDVGQIGDMVLVTATATNAAGSPIPGLAVELSTGAGTVANPIQATDANGKAVFAVDTSGIRGVKAAYLPLQAKAGGAGWEVSLATMMVPVQNALPSLVMTFPTSGATDVEGKDLTLTGTAFDANGIQSVILTVDGEITTVEGNVGDITWAVSKALGEVDDGEHTVVLNATDMLGVSNEITVTFTTSKSTDGISTLLAVLLGIGWIVAAVVIVVLVLMMLAARKGKEEPQAEPEAPEEPKEPEQ